MGISALSFKAGGKIFIVPKPCLQHRVLSTFTYILQWYYMRNKQLIGKKLYLEGEKSLTKIYVKKLTSCNPNYTWFSVTLSGVNLLILLYQVAMQTTLDCSPLVNCILHIWFRRANYTWCSGSVNGNCNQRFDSDSPGKPITQRAHGVYTTSAQRRCNVMTDFQCRFQLSPFQCL